MAKHYRRKSRRETIRDRLILASLVLLLSLAAAVFFMTRCSAVQDNGTSEPVVSEDITERQPAASADAAALKAAAAVSQDSAPVSANKEIEQKPAQAEPQKEVKKVPEKKKQPAIPEPPEKKYTGERPMVAIIIDDGGNRMDYAKRAAALSVPLTWAIIPYLQFSKNMLELAQKNDIPCILHLPMQAITDKHAYQYVIGEGMSEEEVRKKTAAALKSLDGVVGVNNHRGSLSTADRSLMDPLMDELKERSLIFVDSRTIINSCAYAVAREKGVTALRNRGFLDNVSDKKAIRAAFDQILPTARKRGHLVMICHFRPATLLFLEELDKIYKKLPYEFVTLPEMAERLSEE